MTKKRYLSITNFDAAQMYKDRTPLWIKLQCSLLDDYDFAALKDETKFHAVALMLLASRLNNKFPDDEKWLRSKINANCKINLQKLIEIGFLTIIKNPFNVRKSKKINDELVNGFEKFRNLEQNRTEENIKEHITTHETNGLMCEIDNSFQDKAEAGNHLSKEISAQDRNLSKFSIEECKRYAEECKQRGDNITNPSGLANKLFKTGTADAFIMQMLYPERAASETFGAPVRFTDEPCVICLGAKMANNNGKGFSKCNACKNERNHSTGLKPEGTMNQ